MSKRIFPFVLTMALVMVSSTACSQVREILHVWTSGGNETALILNTHPVVSFKTDQMTITSEGQVIEIPFEIVERFTYSKEDISSIPDVKHGLDREGEYVFLPEGTSSDDVCVYSTDGRRMLVNLNDNGRKTILNINSLPKGVYIVKVKNRTFKITRQ